MRLHRSRALAAVLSVCLVTALAAVGLAESPLGRRSVIVQVVDQARPAVVNIQSERTTAQSAPAFDGSLPAQGKANGMGTGIVIDPRGYIVTNHHVIEDVTSIRVRLHDGSTYPGRVIARDRETDLAVLKIDTNRPLGTVRIGTSSDLMVGETVIAIGNAFGYEHTVTVGVVSALGRDVTLNKDIAYRSLIQTDASINPGNSGGPLLNIEGELIGVNVAIRAGAQGIGFAIPVDQMVQVVSELLARKRRAEVATGLVYRNQVAVGQSPCRLVAVERVDSSGPAAEAGVQPGDVILQIGDVTVTSGIDFERALLGTHPGDRVPLRIRRGQSEQHVELALAATKGTGGPGDLAWRHLGLRLSPVSRDVVSRSNGTLRGGMLINEIAPDSPASRAGLVKGDILVGLHQWETINMDNVNYVLTHPDLATFAPLRYFVLRNGQTQPGWFPAD
jgi:serine protease Do